MSIVRVTVAALAVWRLTHLFHSEEGPFGILRILRRGLREAHLSGVTDCFLCLSIWVAVPFGFVPGSSFAEIVILILALSAVTVLIDRLAGFTAGGDLALEHSHQEEFEAWIAETKDGIQSRGR